MMNEVVDEVFNNDPIYMKNLVGKIVQIKTVENKILTGRVYVIDPIFKTLVLHTNWHSDKDFETLFVLHHAIKSLTVVSDEINETYLEKSEENSPTMNMDKKNLIKRWFGEMHICVKESGDYLKIDDHVVIFPPYEPENCVCSNTIILDRIQKILAKMPPEFI